MTLIPNYILIRTAEAYNATTSRVVWQSSFRAWDLIDFIKEF